MAKLNDASMRELVAAHIDPDEQIFHVAYGIKQPALYVMIPLFCLAILPGAIAVMFMTKNYVAALTNRRILFLNVKGVTAKKMLDGENVQRIELSPAEVAQNPGETSTGKLFTHISFTKGEVQTKAKFHRAFSKTNRPSAMAIGAAVANQPMPA